MQPSPPDDPQAAPNLTPEARPRELILLSPYRLPGQNASYLGNEDMAAFLNAYAALWHPAAILGAAAPPRIASPYDHEQPAAGHVYALPETPPLVLPDDWERRARDAGAVCFQAGIDRDAALANLLTALASQGQDPLEEVPPGDHAPGSPADAAARLRALPPDQVAPFLGIGFGYGMLEGLFEAMEHENLIPTSEIWNDVQQAVHALLEPEAEPAATPQPVETPPAAPGETQESDYPSDDMTYTAPHGPAPAPAPEPRWREMWRRHLQSAADQLRTARDVLYPTTIHLLDLCLLDRERLGDAWPASFELGLPVNFVAPGAVLEQLARDKPDRLATLRERVVVDQAEVCGGPYLEREDAVLSIESQIWNLLKGLSVSRELLGQDVRVFGRKHFAAHPQLPALLTGVGLNRCLLLSFEENAVLPSHRATVVNWPSPDGKQVEAFTRAPFAADSAQTGFHVAHYLHRTIMQDHAATLVLLHDGKAPAPWYRDWLELSRFAPVLGDWTTFSRYFSDVLAGEYASAASADEFHGDYLEQRTLAHHPRPVGSFAIHARWRRRLDTAWTLAAMHRGLAGKRDTLGLDAKLADIEELVEKAGDSLPVEGGELAATVAELQRAASEALADRLLVRATSQQQGYLALNPCSWTRRSVLELEGVTAPIPLGGPVKASQLDGSTARVVVEVPALGFAWFPRSGPAQAGVRASTIRMADERCVRNEHLEAEIDPTTGGLRAVRDQRTRVSRIAQMLVWNPGSRMQMKHATVVSTGPALGELVAEGVLLDEQDQELATYRQRLRVWLGRPLLEMRIGITPARPPQGYPWHAYFGCRFAWRDERAALLRGVNGPGHITSHTRPETPDYLEVRYGRQNVVILPGGLPFHQRHGGRMLDVILIPEGETTQVFDLAIGLDRENPMQTALGAITPLPVVPTLKGPPHVGASGWLFHVDVSNVALLSMRPAADGADAIVARLLECSAQGTQVEMRCVRNPQRAGLYDARGNSLLDSPCQGDSCSFEASAGDLMHVRAEFSQ